MAEASDNSDVARALEAVAALMEVILNDDALRQVSKVRQDATRLKRDALAELHKANNPPPMTH